MDLDFDVVELPSCDPPAVGSTAPAFTRPLVTPAAWQDASLASVVAGGPTALVCHPMIGSFHATSVWSEITDRGWLDRDGLTVVGLTISTPYDVTRFLEDRELDTRLFSDPANGVAEAYDVVHDLDGMAGISEPRPAVFVLEADRTVRYRWVATRWPAFPPYDEVAEHLPDA